MCKMHLYLQGESFKKNMHDAHISMQARQTHTTLPEIPVVMNPAKVDDEMVCAAQIPLVEVLLPCR